jgi:xylulokinase
VLDRTVRQMQAPILANVRGAAFLASLALGCLRVEDIPARAPVAHTYAPRPEHRRVYDELYREFRELYRRTRPSYARLNTGK